MTMTDCSKTPVLILGGQENTLSLARSFGRRSIRVFISAPADCLALKSRFCTRGFEVPPQAGENGYWDQLLLGPHTPEELQGCLIFPASDSALEFIADRHDELQERYLLDDARPELVRAMLNKRSTLELADRAGCPTPGFHAVQGLEDLERIAGEVLFPVMVKPVHSHLFQEAYPGRKYLLADNAAELRRHVQGMLQRGLEMIVTELIPGPDDLQSAYFTYMTEDGRELFRYTHQIVRRYPKNSGSACLTVTRQLPETAAMGRRFFRGVGFRGMGHVEFKRDPRDGRLKIMECNARMSAAQAVVTRSGLDMAWRIYEYLVNGTLCEQSNFRCGVRRWWFLLDLRAFLELRARHEITLLEWLRSVKGPPLVFPYFCLDDPMPFVHKAWKHITHYCQSRVRTLCHPTKESPMSN